MSEAEEQVKKKDSVLVYAVIFIAVLIGLLIFIPRFFAEPNYTLEELHDLNRQGKLTTDKGYLYRGEYSFVAYEGLWYLQLQADEIGKIFSIPFHYGPRDVENITPVGVLNYSNLNAHPSFYMTFDPLDDQLNYIGTSTGESVQVFINAFGKGVIGSCSRNETPACANRPIIECNSTEAPVFYFASEEETNLLYFGNCAIVSGYGEDMFRATDRMLFDLLQIME